MNRLIATGLAISAIAFIAPSPASAAALLINDAVTDPNIIFSMNDFEGGFFIDGVQRQIGLNNPQTFTVPESTATGPIVHTFSGDWITAGLVPGSDVVAFAEPGVPLSQGVSDILTFAYTVGPLGGHLTGTFVSDVDPGLLPFPAGATVVSEFTPLLFPNGNITASAISDVSEVPGPIVGAGLPGLIAACGGLVTLARRRRRLVA